MRHDHRDVTDSERALIYMLLTDPPDIQAKIIEQLKPEFFTNQDHRILATEIIKVWSSNQELDSTLLIAVLQENQVSEPLKLIAEIMRLGIDGYIGKTWKSHLNRIKRAHSRQQAILKLSQAIQEMEQGKPVQHLMQEIEALNQESDSRLSTAQVRCLADIESVPVEWVWTGRIAKGKVNLLTGDPGLGKSFVSLDIASRVSIGAIWPDQQGTKAPLGQVLILNSEDNPSDTIRPRLENMTADLNKIFVMDSIRDGQYDRLPSLARDLEQIEKKVTELGGCVLIIIDPISSYLGVDGNKQFDVRGVLDSVKQLAERTGAAVLLVAHLNKSSGSAIYRTNGSISIPGAARIVWVFTKDQEQEERRKMLPVKNNLSLNQGGLAFSLVDGVVEWETEPIYDSADDALSPEPRLIKDSKVDQARQFLKQLLANGAAVQQSDIQAAAEENGIGWRTIERAKKQLGIITKPQFVGGPWFWSLPRRNEVEARPEN